MDTFRDYAYYYNTFYGDKDYNAEAKQIDYLLKKYGDGIADIINFGCGTGKHDIELTKLGYHCAGIDISAEMIDIARTNAQLEKVNIEFGVADICRFISSTQYDAVISLFHVMSYQTRNNDITSAFYSARKSLRSGGIFIFDAWYGSGVLSDKPSVRVKEIEDEDNRLIRIAKPVMHEKENTVDVCYEILVIHKETGETKAINEVHKMRYFFKPELELLLQQSGFALIENLDCHTLEKTDFDSWTSYFIAKAI